MKGFGANVKRVLADVGHGFTPDGVADLIHYLYSNLPGSGVNPSDAASRPNRNWKDDGYLIKFDQRPFIKSALAEYVKHGGSASVDHHLLDYGYFYYPKGCADQKAKSSCKFQLVNHGAGGWHDNWPEAFGPFGAANDIVMVWPACS